MTVALVSPALAALLDDAAEDRRRLSARLAELERQPMTRKRIAAEAAVVTRRLEVEERARRLAVTFTFCTAHGHRETSIV